MITLNFYMDSDDKKLLEQFAKKRKVSMGLILREIIAKFLKELKEKGEIS